MKSILLIRTSSLGDVFQTFPVLEYLSAFFPEAALDWVVEKRVSALVSPFVHQVIEVDSRKWLKAWFSGETRKDVKSFLKDLKKVEYDVAFDLQGNIKSGLILGACRAKDKVGFGWNSSRERLGILGASKRIDVDPSLLIRAKYLKLVQTYFQDKTTFIPNGLFFPLEEKERDYVLSLTQDKSPKFMIALCSKWKNKQLKEGVALSFLKKVSHWIDPAFYFVFGSEEERQWVQKIASFFPGKAHCFQSLSFPVWQALMRRMDGVLSVDSAALHLAGTCNVPTFSFFGPTVGTIFIPEGGTAFQGSCPYGKKFMKQCPVLRTCPTGACMDFPIEPLFARFQEWFQVQCETARRQLLL